MGTWNINIRGRGCHHNGNPEIDADLAAKEFVKTLKKQGHEIESATLTLTGGDTDLLPPKTPVSPSSVESGDGYVIVQEGEIIQDGDEYLTGYGTWLKTEGLSTGMPARYGRPPGQCGGWNSIHRRKI